MIVLYILLAVVVLLMMVTIHEFGHYTAGKMLGFKINEFAIGFGPALFKKTRKNGEIFSIRAVPLGGYCAFDGEDKESDNSQSFMKQKPWKRLIVLFFGGFFNILSAIIFSFVLLVSVGYDVPTITKINEINGISQTQLQVGDTITKVEGVKISYIKGNDFNTLISKYNEGDTFSVSIIRNGEKLDNVVLTMLKNNDGQNVLGINIKATPYSFGESLLYAIPFTFKLAVEILKIFGLLLIGKISLTNLGGPITTVSQMATLSMQGISNFLVLLPLIAVNLGVFNLLPIPALDGSKMVFTTIEWIRGKPINQRVENTIHTVGLILLFALVIFADLYHIITGSLGWQTWQEMLNEIRYYYGKNFRIFQRKKYRLPKIRFSIFWRERK